MKQDTSYTEMANTIIGKKILACSDIYYYEGDLKGIYEGFFRFGIETLQKKEFEGLFPNTYIAYIDDFRINAFARKTADYGLIGINYGLIENMLTFFSDNENLFDKDEFRKYKDSANAGLEQPVSFCLFKCFTIFIFSHELGHLLQTVNTTSHLDETFKADYSEKTISLSHLKEFDADLFACAYLAEKFTNDFFALPNDDRNYKNFANLSVIAFVSVYLFFFKSSEYHTEIYFNKHSHPHPFIRLGYFSKFFIANLNKLNSEFQLDHEMLFQSAIDLSNIILGISEENINNMLENNYAGIKTYTNLLEEKAFTVKGLTLNNFFKASSIEL